MILLFVTVFHLIQVPYTYMYLSFKVNHIGPTLINFLHNPSVRNTITKLTKIHLKNGFKCIRKFKICPLVPTTNILLKY